MTTSNSNSKVPPHLSGNFRTIDDSKFTVIESSLRRHYFARSPEGYLSTDWGKNDLHNHLYRRLESDRNVIVPWLDRVRPLRGTTILEIGCGTGCSTVALAEQGAEVIGLDVDQEALKVATERCRAYELNVNLVNANATEAQELFPDRHFDYIIFYAALEHMTLDERMAAMRTTWQMLAKGALWCVIETPNRLWYYDGHTSLLPFNMWLPDELAFHYSRFSPRPNYRERYREYTEETKLDFLRRGRGVSFHEFELAMKPLNTLQIRSSLHLMKQKKRVRERRKRRRSNDDLYIYLLRKIAAGVHEGFLQSSLNLIIEKD